MLSYVFDLLLLKSPRTFEGLKKLLVGRPKCGRSIWANLGFYRLSWQLFKYAALGSKVNGFKISVMRLFSLKICLLAYFLQISADDTSCRLPISPTKIGCWARSIKAHRRFTGNRDAEDCPRSFPKIKIGWPIDRKKMGHLDVKFLFTSKTAFEWINFGCFQGILWKSTNSESWPLGVQAYTNSCTWLLWDIGNTQVVLDFLRSWCLAATSVRSWLEAWQFDTDCGAWHFTNCHSQVVQPQTWPFIWQNFHSPYDREDSRYFL